MADTVVFDESFDVIVVGYGFAGAFTALNACDAGARVLLAEKQPDPGGISICSYGSMRCAHDADDAFAYLKVTNAGRTPDDVVRALADGMTRIEPYIRELAKVSNATVELRENGGNYPFPGEGTFYDTNVTAVPGWDDPRVAYPHVVGGRSGNGWRVFRVLEDNVARRPITVRCSFAAERLIADADREVQGVWFRDAQGRRVAIKARRGVVLACGGFEANPAMQQQYWEKSPVLSVATLGNTGDGIRMAQELGAELWHMWHYHGAHGFKHPDPNYPFAIRAKNLPNWFPGRPARHPAKMCWIVLDRDGKRYMNECPPYVQDIVHRPMEFYDSVRQMFPRVPSYLVYDETGRKMYPIGQAIYNQRGLDYEWSDDNLREIELGIIKKAQTLDELAHHIGAPPATVRASIERWNGLCAKGADDDFGRPDGMLMPIAEPPYYVGEIWPMVSNTQGGPVHNARQQVLNSYGEPIPRLYAAGELGSAMGFLYLAAANLSECVVGGWTAGRETASLPPWD